MILHDTYHIVKYHQQPNPFEFDRAVQSAVVTSEKEGEAPLETALHGAPPDAVLTGRFEPGEERRYAHVPFTVPERVRQIHLRCSYPDKIGSDPALSGGNTLDIGLFDEQGIEGSGPGFRGWSGSERLEFTIGDDWATPPYRPGPIGAGVWHVLLGPYKIGPRGLDYRVELFFNRGIERAEIEPATPVMPPVKPRRVAAPGWVRGDLHCHTRHSDGDSWPSEMLAAAAAAGLDFLGITDHNGVLPHDPPPPGSGLPLLVPGVEVTTYGGHWNAWGGKRWYDFREPDGAKVGAIMREAVADGALVSVNHPKPLGPPWSFSEASGYGAIEIWNGPWLALNAMALAVWDDHLRRGERIVALGGSDTHRLRHHRGRLYEPYLGEPTTWVEIGDQPLTVESLLAALKAGRCFITASPDCPQAYLTRPTTDLARVRIAGGAGGVLLLLSERGCFASTPIGEDDAKVELTVPEGTRYVRAQVMDAFGSALAISNPVWS
jgi:hypothetical protein